MDREKDLLVASGAILARKAKALLDAVTADNNQHGGLISRATIRTADELRLELLKNWK